MKNRLQFLFTIGLISALLACSNGEETTQKTPEQPIQQKTIAEKQLAFAAIKSLPRVIEGYKSFYRRWPQSMQDFDNGEYFFDTDYQAESIAKGFTVYLALTNDETGYKLWVLPENAKSGYLLTEDGKSLTELSTELLLSQIDSSYRQEAKKGALIFLTTKDRSP
ncbi:MAG TPA: hypothetical protein VIR78_02385 [Malonomonas sp.]